MLLIIVMIVLGLGAVVLGVGGVAILISENRRGDDGDDDRRADRRAHRGDAASAGGPHGGMMPDVMKIGYLTVPVSEYIEAINAATSPVTLVAAILPYELVAGDALDAARAIGVRQWPVWRRGLLRERRGTYDRWVARYGAILVPEIMMQVNVVAKRYRVPWGTAYLRARDLNLIVEERGRARWKAKKMIPVQQGGL